MGKAKPVILREVQATEGPRSTWGKPGDEMRLDIDPLNHPAWQGGAQKVIEKGQLSKFEKRFGSFLSTGPAAKEEGKK